MSASVVGICSSFLLCALNSSMRAAEKCVFYYYYHHYHHHRHPRSLHPSSSSYYRFPVYSILPHLVLSGYRVSSPRDEKSPSGIRFGSVFFFPPPEPMNVKREPLCPQSPSTGVRQRNFDGEDEGKRIARGATNVSLISDETYDDVDTSRSSPPEEGQAGAGDIAFAISFPRKLNSRIRKITSTL